MLIYLFFKRRLIHDELRILYRNRGDGRSTLWKHRDFLVRYIQTPHGNLPGILLTAQLHILVENSKSLSGVEFFYLFPG